MNKNLPMPASQNLTFVEALYSDYLCDPVSVPADWQSYFKTLTNGDAPSTASFQPKFAVRSIFNPTPVEVSNGGVDSHFTVEQAKLRQDRLDQMVRSFRMRGHMIAQINPLGLPRAYPPELEPGYYGFTEADMDRKFSCATLPQEGMRTLRQITDKLRNTYCRSIGVEYLHIDELPVRRWLRERMEGSENRRQITREQQLRILTRLTDAVTFEEFIRKNFIGAKSFSLEGSESLIPLLDLAIERAGDHGTREIIIGMAHRGRLNVLANIMGKSPGEIFREFADSDPDTAMGHGDVKYHKGYSKDWKTASDKTVHISLCFNPSHLEFVNPVALGRVRSKQDQMDDTQHTRGLAILIHGDAAFIGQGVAQESLNLSQLEGYTTGGTLHIVVNNQIGFTTSPSDARSSNYCTDVAKMIGVPIFHVNGEDPEAVAQVVELSLEFRETFQRDVVIDMYGYRRLGHNETDEPSFTQPLLYKAIQDRKPVREGYLDHLLKLGGITMKDAHRIGEARQEVFEKELSAAKSPNYKPPTPKPLTTWTGLQGGPDALAPEVDTGFPKEQLIELGLAQTQLPADFHPHPKISKLLAQRAKMATGEVPLDWAMGEALAWASLATTGTRVRLSGQDVGRGTFSHRHAVLHDIETGQKYIPLQHLTSTQAPVDFFNSPLSEVAVLGFEYGYSLDYPRGLVMWEAQFGDFSNVAQVIIDQFIASAEEKWRKLSGLVMMLPHGFEGQGPEHSSARLERFLAIAADDNIQVVYPSSPAQMFHLLRRQILRTWRKPLIIMTPKSGLRQPEVVSPLEDFATGSFQRIISDQGERLPKSVTRILLCSGKIYYELAKKRAALNREDVAILRLEQLYPLREDLLAQALAPYNSETPIYWVQEEPANMGAWPFLRLTFGERLLGRFPLLLSSRSAAASPATGSLNVHKREQEQVLQAAFAS